MGVVEMIAKGLERHGLPLLQARRRFWRVPLQRA